MKFRLALVVGAAALLAGAWWALLPPDAPQAPVASSPVAATATPAAEPGPAAVPAPAVGTRPDTRMAVVAVAPRPSLFNDYLKARQYRGIYDRLKASAEGETAEGRLVLYEILRNCATITEGRRYVWRPSTPKREDFVAGIAPSDPQRDKRIAAYDEFTANRCQGLEGVSLTQAELDKMLADSAAAGDPRARAMAIEQEAWRNRRTQGRESATLTDAQIESLKELAGTRDPEAIRVAGRVLSNSWADYALRVGPDQLPIEPRAFMNAWLVLACEYGQPCGADTPRMQQACALQGHCDAMSYPDYLNYYASSPHESTLLAQYRLLLRQAIETGNWSQLTVVRGVPYSSNRMTFVPGPR